MTWLSAQRSAPRHSFSHSVDLTGVLWAPEQQHGNNYTWEDHGRSEKLLTRPSRLVWYPYITWVWKGPRWTREMPPGCCSRNCTGDERSRGHCGAIHGKARVYDTREPTN